MSEPKPIPTTLEVVEARLDREPNAVATIPHEVNVFEVAMREGVDLKIIEKLMEFQAKLDAREAEKAYFAAKAAFSAEAPPVTKDKLNSYFKSKYTSLGNLLATYGPVLGRHGLSVSFPTPKQEGNKMVGYCKLSHAMGHSETTELEVPIDQAATGKQSGKASRNPTQDIKSTLTYVRSATCEMALGVAGSEAGSFDNDGNTPAKDEPTLTEKEVADMECALVEMSNGEKRILGLVRKDRGYNATDLEDIRRIDYKYVMGAIAATVKAGK